MSTARPEKLKTCRTGRGCIYSGCAHKPYVGRRLPCVTGCAPISRVPCTADQVADEETADFEYIVTDSPIEP